MRDVQLPITLVPYDDESATGFILRSLQTNGVNMHWLRRSVGLPELHMLTQTHAHAVAWVLQCSELWLVTKLDFRWKSEGSYFWSWNNYEFFCSNHLRRRHPQVCPQCVHLNGYCKQIWDLAVVTHCSEHLTILLDECEHCRTRLRWDRPSVDVCHCGHVLTSVSEAVSNGAPFFELLDILQVQMRSEFLGDGKRDTLTSKFLTNMSLPGVLTLIYAFGILEREFQVISPSLRTKSIRTLEWAGIVRRAWCRLETLNLEQPNKSLQGIVDAISLSHLLNKSIDPVDQQIAMLLLVSFPQGLQSKFLPRTSQAALF